MPRLYVSIADANRILDTGQECLTLEHAKKLAVQTAEELAREQEYSHLRGKYVQVTDERGNLVYKSRYRMGCPSAVSSMECGSTGLEVGLPLRNSGEAEYNAFQTEHDC
jgi:hypothetical protein